MMVLNGERIEAIMTAVHTLSSPTRSVQLSAGMIWSNEYRYAPVHSAQTPTLDGGMVVEQSIAFKGRPLTLAGAEDHGWIRKSALDELIAMASVVEPLTFAHADGRSFAVVWAKSPIDAHPVLPLALPKPTDWYVVTLNLLIL